MNTAENKEFNKAELFKLIEKIEAKKINSSKISKEMIKEVIVKKASAKEAFKAHNIVQISSTKILTEHITEILDSNAHQLKKLARNSTKLEKFVLGQLQAKTAGQANPTTSAEVYKGLIKAYLASKAISNSEEGN